MEWVDDHVNSPSRLSLAMPAGPKYESTPLSTKVFTNRPSIQCALTVSDPFASSSQVPEFSASSISSKALSVLPSQKMNSSSPASKKSVSNTVQYRSPSPNGMQSYLKASPISSRYSDIESTTIQRQRKELQLMINELKDRDRELNEMVHSHHKQLVSWEMDRQRVFMLEKQHAKLRSELKQRHDQCKLLKSKLKLSESENLSKKQELETTQIHLQQLSEKESISSSQLEEFMSKNENLENSVQELSSTVGKLHAKEQDYVTLLNLKENDVKEANIRIKELSEKLKRTSAALQEAKLGESTLRSEYDKCHAEVLSLRTEVESLRVSMTQHHSSQDERHAELTQLKQEVLVLQKELFLAGEREKRKDSLLDLSKSKQERTEVELSHLRGLYERQQHGMMYLQQQMISQDDRLSLASTTDYEGSSDTGISLSRALPSFRDRNAAVASLDGYKTPVSKVLDLKEFDELSVDDCEDFGKMSANELRSGDSESTLPLLQDPSKEGLKRSNLSPTLESCNSSPTSRLHHLLAESRRMVEDLERSSGLTSSNTSPVHQSLRNHSNQCTDNLVADTS